MADHHYVVEERLGRGGMGVVDLATAPDGTRVALKRIGLAGSAEATATARARIRREAEVLAQLDHPRIVRLLDVVEDGDDLVLVFPWLQGGSLADRVDQHGPLRTDEVEAIADDLLGALASAHRSGVVHRDLKPANVLFDADGHAHLADFGVARGRDLTMGLTGEGHAIGTPGFLAPEQARGEDAGPAADVFGLGATLRWALTGSGPYGDAARDVVLHRAADGKVQTCPATVPDGLRRRIDSMLDPRPERRPTAAALAGGPEGTDERPTTVRSERRGPKAVSMLAVVGASVVALLGGLAVSRPSPSRPPAAAAAEETTTSDCRDLPYQPCGQEPAPGTDGRRCIDGRGDYDGEAANGCEAIPDDLDGTALGAVEATIVPVDDTDEFTVEVDDHFHLGCDGHVDFDLAAPTGMSLRLEIRSDAGDVLGEVTSSDGVPGHLRLDEPQCAGDDSGTLVAVVTPIGTERSSEPYTLERTGSF